MTGAPVSLLDNIRISNGPESLKNYFTDLYHTERSKLLELLNDRHLRFYTLFLLKAGIYAYRLQDDLIPMYKWALMISDRLSELLPGKPPEPISDRPHGRKKTGAPAGRAALRRAGIRKMLRSDTDVLSAALKWIVETGWDPDIPEGSYELFLERCTSILLGEFRDRSVLPVLADIIFDRHRKGLLVHNLVWAFFKARDQDSLYLLVQKLQSENVMDVRLAKKLLRFIPGIENSDNSSGPALYYRAVQWLSENMPYLYFTDESMHMCGCPIFCRVSAGEGSE